MLCYKDRTFCSSDCTNRDCYRHLTPDDKNKAAEMDLLISWSDFSDTCPDYKEPST
jgi:hypothetical protein